VHALVHWIEGDDENTAYWYRRADKTRHSGSIEEEWQIIRMVVEKLEAHRPALCLHILHFTGSPRNQRTIKGDGSVAGDDDTSRIWGLGGK